MFPSFRKVLTSYIPPVLTTGILGTLFLHEYDEHVPEKYKINASLPFSLAKRSVPPPEFAGDCTPQRGVYCGGERQYSAILVLQGTNNCDKKVIAKSASKAILPWDRKDVDVSLGFSPRVWEAVKGHVPLGNTSINASKDFKLKDRVSDKTQRSMTNSGGDIFVHVKADSQASCVEIVKAVIKGFDPQIITWSEDSYGYKPECPRSLQPMCPSTSTSPALCSIACVPKVGNSFALYQRWDDDLEHMKGKAKPPLNHSERVKGMDENGKKLEIVKNTFRTGKFGTRASGDDKAATLFVGYSSDPRIFDYMLDRMFGKRGGIEDSTLLFSKCSRSQCFIIPSHAQINALANSH